MVMCYKYNKSIPNFYKSCIFGQILQKRKAVSTHNG